MNLFNVYPLFDVEPVKAEGCYLWDEAGTKYLDFYGGHAVISVGHSHPHYIKRLTDQLNRMGFYSNSVPIRLQKELAEKLGRLSGYDDWNLFLCNSGAEANENALKVASASNQRKKVLVFDKAFHGRTSLAVAATDNPGILFPVNEGADIVRLPLNDTKAAITEIEKGDVCAVLIEGIQGISGIRIPEKSFLQELKKACLKTGTVLILDEIQSGYGRTGTFFAHQHAAIEPDIVTVAKGMGNGYPVAGVLIHPKFKAKFGMLGTTFGGNHLACAAAFAVLEILEDENLPENAVKMGEYLTEQLKLLPGIKEIRGRGLMVGVEFEQEAAGLRKQLLADFKIFTGSSSNKKTIRLLPPLTITTKETDQLIAALKEILA